MKLQNDLPTIAGIKSPSYQWTNYSPVNQMYILIQELAKIENVPGLADQRLNKNLQSLKALLTRLRQIHQLYRIGSVSNRYLNTPNISPFGYEAMLKLVNLLGVQQSSNSIINPIINQFRFWMNLFTRGNIFDSLTKPMPESGYKYDPIKLKLLIKFLEDNEKRRQQAIENNRIKSLLENLIANQNKQQQQIDAILKLLTKNRQPT